MNRVRFAYEVTVILRLNRYDVETLSRLCERHYDSAVRGLSEPGTDAILNGARNCLRDGEAWTETEVTRRQLDLLAKACEGMERAYRERFVSLIHDVDTERARVEIARAS